MRGTLVAVLALTMMLAGRRPAPRPRRRPAPQLVPAALALARQLLTRLVVPAGSQAAGSQPANPSPLSLPSAGNFSPATVNLHRFVQVRESAVAVHAFLLRHVPAGMVWAGYDLAPDPANAVAGVWVAYRPRSVPAGLTEPELGTTTLPAAGGTLIRVDASVSWFRRAAPPST